MDTKLPNFLIIGVPRAGTTSLYYYLKAHPQIFLSPVKEPFFLAFAGEKFFDPENITPSMVTDFAAYHKLFRGAGRFPAVGEASTFYLYYCEKTIANIKKYLPDWQDLKIIAVLRNPVDRAFSHYGFNQRNFKETLSFEEALQEEPGRIKRRDHFTYYYQATGYYHEALKSYRENFRQVKVVLYDDYLADPANTIKGLYSFLEVDDRFMPDLKRRYNPSGRARSKLLLRLTYGEYPLKNALVKILPKRLRDELTRLSSKFNLNKTKMAEYARLELIKQYDADITKLSKLINRNLRNWYKDAR